MVVLKHIEFTDEGRTILYHYDINGKARKYLNSQDRFFSSYQIDVSSCDLSIAVIPFVANMMPIAWFAGFDLQIEELDSSYFDSLEKIKQIFAKSYPDRDLKGRLQVNQLKKNSGKEGRVAMLFSGGIDAFATYLRIIDKNPILTTVHGADIELDDLDQWNSFRSFIEEEPFLRDNDKTFISSNLRTFYTYRVQLMLKDIGWWGKIQHGLALIGSLAPLSQLMGISEIYIASSYTDYIDISWGSTPEIDSSMSWAGVRVFHDGYELKRQDKVDLIAAFSLKNQKEFRLRVCYSELRDGFNCSKCEKCYRTILGLILAGRDPNNFGFEVKASVYNDIIKMLSSGMSSKGMRYFWWELIEKSRGKINPFIFDNKEQELDAIDNISRIEIDFNAPSQTKRSKKLKGRLVFIIKNRFNNLYNMYHRLRYNSQ